MNNDSNNTNKKNRSTNKKKRKNQSMGFGFAVEELSVQDLRFRVPGLRFRDMA